MDLSVNVLSLSNNVEFTRNFKRQEVAESYIREIDTHPGYRVVEYNFTPRFTGEELDAWDAHVQLLLKEADRLQQQGVARTTNNFKNPDYNPCEVCGGKHANYECCHDCNYNYHRCHFCGDDLGHSEVSVCYILDGFNE